MAIGALSIAGALALSWIAVKVASFAARVIVYAAMAVVLFADCAALYLIGRQYYLADRAAVWGEPGLVAALVGLLFAANLFVAVLFLPLMRTAGIEPDEF